VKLERDQSLRLLHLGTPEFDYRIEAGEQVKTVAFPYGTAIAGIFESDGTATALSRPFVVAGGTLTDIAPRKPERADLMLVISKRPLSMSNRRVRHQPFVLKTEEQELRPDIFFESDGRIIAIWYEAPAGTATVTGEATHAAMQIELEPERITTIRREIVQGPNQIH
jgi:hypothetical protein